MADKEKEQQPLPTTEEVALDPVEVQIDDASGEAKVVAATEEAKKEPDEQVDGDVDSGDEPEQEGEAKKPKRAQPRIARLTREKEYYETAARNLEQQLLQERSARVKAEQQAAVSNEAMMENYAARVKRDLETAQSDYERAVETADVKAQAEANTRLAKAAAAQADVDAWVENKKSKKPAAEQQQQEQPQAPQRQQQAPAPMDPTVQRFIKNNPWWDKDSDTFDEDAHVAVVNYAAVLENRLRAQGRETEINGDAYWDKINKYIGLEFPDYASAAPAAPARKTPPMNGGSPVGAARGGQSLPGQTSAGQSQRVTLSADERKMARNLADNGALTYPTGHQKAGQRMNHQDAEIHYARQKQAHPPRQAQGR
jgi:hypothetical protein